MDEVEKNLLEKGTVKITLSVAYLIFFLNYIYKESNWRRPRLDKRGLRHLHTATIQARWSDDLCKMVDRSWVRVAQNRPMPRASLCPAKDNN